MYLGKKHDELQKNNHLRLSPDKNFAVNIETKETEKKVFQVWNVIQDNLVMEIPVNSKDKYGYEAFWSNDETRLAVFHDFEILLLDTTRKEWKRIPVPNMNITITKIHGIWSWDGEIFYYFQPSIFTGFFGGELKRVVWSKR